MEINYIMTGLGISYGVNFILLYTRKQKWNTDQLRWVISGLLLVIGVMGLFGVFNKTNNDFHFFSWCLVTPIIYNGLDRLFKRISEVKNNRDFYLWLRNSFEIDNSLFGKNPHVNGLDKLLSMTLLCIIIILPILGMK